MRTILRVLPLRCQLCHHRLEEHRHAWCQVCDDALPKHPRCLQCGLPTPYDIESCGKCLSSPPSWDSLVCVGNYTFPYTTLLHRFKYQRQYWLGKSLASLIATRIDDPAPVVVPIPMHWRRRWHRGYNHSNVLARSLAKQLDVDCEPNLLKRVKATRQQKGLDRQSRLSNLKHAFAVSAPVPEHIALVDDVVTTGTTISMCANCYALTEPNASTCIVCAELRRHHVNNINHVGSGVIGSANKSRM
ncbi:ComF family protein [Enterovibrio coralii]|uniref:ComF family protein n=1 Tax=Enterovibrio coralii TaxID=294935 RepID=UPI001E3E10C8|nr:double zinc ribbon domain-containing protein [Enterovibrio coralii]